MPRNSKSGTIMVVDDKPSNLRLLEKMLSEQDYRVRIFPKGKLALQSALNDPPDLILLDINMPDMNGYEVCQNLKASEETKDLPVIFISAMTDAMDKIKAFQLGGVDYITKPFQIEEVHARISLHLTLKRTQNALEEKNRELQATLDRLKSAQQQLIRSEKMAALGVLTAGIAHEINNPVNFIKTSVLGLRQDLQDMDELLQAYEGCVQTCPDQPNYAHIQTIRDAIDIDTLKAEIPELVVNIQQGVTRTEEIINSLRSYSRMDPIHTETTDPNELIETALVILRNRYKNHIAIVKKLVSLPKISIHPGKITQVLINLLSNAIDAVDAETLPGKGVITLETGRQARDGVQYAAITIADNGPGIPEVNQNKIFDPFFTTKEVGRGTGLGLSICAGIIEEHHGMIELDAKEGSGTTFSILLPLNSA